MLSNHTSDGTQGKYIIGDLFYKEDNYGCYESISEVLISEFYLYIKNLPNVLDYSFGESNTCVSKVYTSENISDVSVYRLLEGSEYSNILDSVYDLPCEIYYNGIIMALSDITGVGTDIIRDYFEKVILLDYITRNTDRHLNNILFLHNIDTNLYSLAPIMDNGQGLISDTLSYPMGMDIDRAYRLCTYRCKPFSSDFNEQLCLVGDARLVIDIVGFKSRISEILSNLDSYVPFKKRYFRRAVDFLLYSLQESEGKAWIGIT